MTPAPPGGESYIAVMRTWRETIHIPRGSLMLMTDLCFLYESISSEYHQIRHMIIIRNVQASASSTPSPPRQTKKRFLFRIEFSFIVLFSCLIGNKIYYSLNQRSADFFFFFFFGGGGVFSLQLPGLLTFFWLRFFNLPHPPLNSPWRIEKHVFMYQSQSSNFSVS